MSPEASAPLSPALALLILGVLCAVAFAWVKTRLKRYAETKEPLPVLAAETPAAQPAPTPEPPTAEMPAPPTPPQATAEPLAAAVAPVEQTASSPAPKPGERPRVTIASVPPATSSQPSVATTSAQAAPVRVGLFEMAAPVELWFGELRVAVRVGSNTEKRFQRYATVLLDELRRAQRAEEHD